MSQVFACCRISTLDQATENRRREIESVGFRIKPQQVIGEHIDGSAATGERPSFNRLLARLKCGDQLIVTKLDRLGCNAIDIRKVVEQLTEAGIRMHCLALGGIDLTSPTGKVMMQVISVVAEFERDLLLERTHSRIVETRSTGKRFGRPPVSNEEQKQMVFERIKSGVSISAITREFKTSRQTILRAKAKLRTPDIQKVVSM